MGWVDGWIDVSVLSVYSFQTLFEPILLIPLGLLSPVTQGKNLLAVSTTCCKWQKDRIMTLSGDSFSGTGLIRSWTMCILQSNNFLLNLFTLKGQ